MLPSMQTALLFYAIMYAIGALIIATMHRYNRRRFASISFWLIFMVATAVGGMFIVLRSIVPQFLSVIVANTLIVGGFLILYIGLERFFGKKSSQIHNYILTAIFFSVHAYFTYIKPNVAARIYNISAIMIALTFQCAWLLFRRTPKDNSERGGSF